MGPSLPPAPYTAASGPPVVRPYLMESGLRVCSGSGSGPGRPGRPGRAGPGRVSINNSEEVSSEEVSGVLEAQVPSVPRSHRSQGPIGPPKVSMDPPQGSLGTHISAEKKARKVNFLSGPPKTRARDIPNPLSDSASVVYNTKGCEIDAGFI